MLDFSFIYKGFRCFWSIYHESIFQYKDPLFLGKYHTKYHTKKGLFFLYFQGMTAPYHALILCFSSYFIVYVRPLLSDLR